MNSRSIPSSYTRLDRSSSNGTNRNGTGRNGNTRSRRRPRWHRGSRLPSGILPPLPSSLDVATNTNTEDCVANALAVLRSTKRPKYCVDEEEAQQHYQDDNDSNDSESNSPQTPSIDNDAPTLRLLGSLTAAASTECVGPQISRPKGWEWSIGTLPQTLTDDQIFEQRQHKEFQYSRLITPLLYSTKFPSGRNSSSFLSGPPPEGGERIRRLVAIHPRLERQVTP